MHSDPENMMGIFIYRLFVHQKRFVEPTSNFLQYLYWCIALLKIPITLILSKKHALLSTIIHHGWVWMQIATSDWSQEW